MKEIFEPGDEVMTPGGSGRVAYKRMAPPTYSEVDVYSVRLDKDWHPGNPHYSGTIYPAGLVTRNKTTGHGRTR
jgi:hypothetical protein